MPKTIEIVLDDQGFPGSTVRFKDARYMPRKKFEALATAMAESVAETGTQKSDDFLRSRIVSWEISYTDEDNESVSLKNIAADNFGDLPTPLYVFLWSQLAKTFEVEIPKELRRQ